jgi:hypothetical protein
MSLTDAEITYLQEQQLGRLATIQIHPTRVLSFGVEEPPGEPHQTRLYARDLR